MQAQLRCQQLHCTPPCMRCVLTAIDSLPPWLSLYFSRYSFTTAACASKWWCPQRNEPAVPAFQPGGKVPAAQHPHTVNTQDQGAGVSLGVQHNRRRG